MKHVKETPRQRFVYRFTDEEMLGIIVAHLRSERWEVPHQDDTASKELVQINSHWELVIEKQHPKETVADAPICQFPKPEPKPEPKNPYLVDTTNMTSEDLFAMALLKSEQERAGVQPVKAAPAKVLEVTDRHEGLEIRTGRGRITDLVTQAILRQAKAFTVPDLRKELGIPRGENESVIRKALGQFVEAGQLTMKNAGRQGPKPSLVFTPTNRPK